VIIHILKSDPPQFNDAKTEGNIFLEEVPNADRLYIAVRAFLLILRDVEQSIGSSEKNTAGAVSAVQSSSGLVLVEGKINLTPPDFPDFERESDGSIQCLLEIGSRELQNARIRTGGDRYPLRCLDLTLTLFIVIGPSITRSPRIPCSGWEAA